MKEMFVLSHLNNKEQIVGIIGVYSAEEKALNAWREWKKINCIEIGKGCIDVFYLDDLIRKEKIL